MATELQLIDAIVSDIARTFKIPKPRIAFGCVPKGALAAFFEREYKICFIRGAATPPVIVHEMAHAMHSHYGVECRRSACETFAEMFEDIYVGSRLKSPSETPRGCATCNIPLVPYPVGVVSCQECGYKAETYTCLRCRTPYILETHVHRYPTTEGGRGVTAVVTALNEEELLPLCLERLLSQSRPPDEIILVDGYSTDATPEIAESYGVRVLYEEGGIYRQKRRGFLEAENEFIVSLDGDTYLCPKWVERAYAWLQDPEVSLVTSRIKPRNGDAFTLGIAWLYNAVGPISGCAYAFRRENYLLACKLRCLELECSEDICQRHVEVPLKQFHHVGQVVYDREIAAYTRLPTRKMKNYMKAASMISTTAGILRVAVPPKA